MEHDPFRLIIPIEVRFSDLDALGHVNNVTYFSYFEIARVKYLYAVSGKPVTIDDIKLVLVEANCRYRAQAQLGDVLEVGVRVSHMRRSSFVFEYRIRRSGDGSLIAEGRTVQAVFDHQSQLMAPIADSFREQVERFEQRTFNVREPIPPWEPREREIEQMRHPTSRDS
jgi:acyl-CoA thioester hydrolase